LSQLRNAKRNIILISRNGHLEALKFTSKEVSTVEVRCSNRWKSGLQPHFTHLALVEEIDEVIAVVDGR
jgi:hypothetical protein